MRGFECQDCSRDSIGFDIRIEDEHAETGTSIYSPCQIILASAPSRTIRPSLQQTQRCSLAEEPIPAFRTAAISKALEPRVKRFPDSSTEAFDGAEEETDERKYIFDSTEMKSEGVGVLLDLGGNLTRR